MSTNRIIVSSVVLEGRPESVVADDYGVTYRWVHTLVQRYLAGGWDAIEPRSRRPHTSPSRILPEVEAEVLRLRRELLDDGHDAGPHTIAFHLPQTVMTPPSVATIWRT